MSFRASLRSALGRWDGTSGRPRSANGASSLHLGWPAPDGPWVTAEVTLEVLEAPSIPKLYFWAMQVSFTDRGRRGGAGHIGLQHHAHHPGSTALNWGGYTSAGGELSGSDSSLPSAAGNVNTRDYSWSPGRPYRLRVSSAGEGPNGLSAWRGEVIDLTSGDRVHVRDLWAEGTTLSEPMVWSEVFADCDDPSTAVRWSDFRLGDAKGRTVTPDLVTVNYQRVSEGGCTRTNSSTDATGWVQTTNTERTTPQGSTLAPGQGQSRS